jgi:diketogulonate reductase-like aldo/keto reductase
VRKDLMQTLVDLRTDYLDSYLIHWPQASPSLVRRPAIATNGAYPAHVSKGTMFPFDDDGYFVSDDGVHFTETWEAMQALVSEGIVRSIGVCNFNRAQISEILAMKDCKYPPAIVQNESHPYLQQKDLIDFCNIHKIVFQAFSALGSGVKYLKNNPSPSGTVPLYDEYIEFLAKKHHKTTAQIIMRWHVQRNRGKCGLVAKTFNFERIRANINIFDFELDEQDMAGFDALNYGWRHLHFRSTANHCDYPFKDELPYNFKPEKAPVEF